MVHSDDHSAFTPQDSAVSAEAGPLQILLVEDSIGDALLTTKALELTQIPYTLQVLRKGGDLLSHLRSLQKDGTLPDLIMLDLGLPGVNGFDVLESLGGSPSRLRQIPIIILTGLANFDYIAKTNKLSIAAYMQKPCNTEQLKTIMRRLCKARDML